MSRESEVMEYLLKSWSGSQWNQQVLYGWSYSLNRNWGMYVLLGDNEQLDHVN